MTTQARTDILNPDRRQLLSQAAMTAVAASVSSLLPLHSAKAGVSGAVRPFHVSVPEQDLLDLRRLSPRRAGLIVRSLPINRRACN